MSWLSDIDKKIEELSNNQLTSDALTLLGDLYLKKGDKKRAIEHFYKAAARLSLYSERDKTISIYKKILYISPSEIDAYERIIDVFSKAGLIAEGTRYLLSLAQLYVNKGDYKKANLLFGKIYELDPKNKAAEIFFSKEKLDAESINPPEEEEEGEIKEEISSTKEAMKKEQYLSMSKRKISVVLIASVLVLFAMLGLSLYLLGKGSKGKGIVKISESLWAINTKNVRGDNFEISVTRLSEKLLYKLPIASRLSQKELSENGFYLVKIKALKGCIPDDFVKSTQRYISLINKEGKLIKPKEFAGLDGIKKVIYKPNICQKESGIVFTHFYIACPKELSLVGISIDGLEKDYPLTVKWN